MGILGGAKLTENNPVGQPLELVNTKPQVESLSKAGNVLRTVEKLNILSKSRYNVDLILVMYYISAGQTSLLQVHGCLLQNLRTVPTN